MIRRSLALAIALSLLALAGCKREAEAPAAAAAHENAPAKAEADNAVVSVIDHGSPTSAAPGFDAKAFAGTYGGTLPCADCPGIDTAVAFTPEGGYSMSETYQSGDGSSFVGKGSWTLRADGKTVLLDPEDKEARDRLFQIVSPAELRALDADGKPVDGTLRRR